MALSDDIQKLYIAYFNRPADPAGLAFWIEQATKDGGSTAAIANAFSGTAEYQATYAGLSSTDIVNKVYQNLFGRPAEPGGLQFWTAQLDAGALSVSNIVTAVFGGAQNSDSVVLTNKTAAAVQFTASLKTPEQIAAYSTPAAAELAAKWLSGATTPEGLQSALTGMTNVTGTPPVVVPGDGDGPVDTAIYVRAGGTFEGIEGRDDVFKSTIEDLQESTIKGNPGDTDTLILTTAGRIRLHDEAGANVRDIKVVNLADGTNDLRYASDWEFTTINGGAGDDTVMVRLPTIKVDAGAGIDTLAMSASDAARVTANDDFTDNVKGFERLDLRNVRGETIDLAMLGGFNYVTLSVNRETPKLLNLPSNGTIELIGAGEGLTIDSDVFEDGDDDTVNLLLRTDDERNQEYAASGITADGVEVLNIAIKDTSETPSGDDVDRLRWLGNDLKAVTVSGNRGLELSTTSVALTNVDASAVTLGSFSWTAGAVTSEITATGGAGGNEFHFMAALANVNYSGGSAGDTVFIRGYYTNTVDLGSGDDFLALSAESVTSGTYRGGEGVDWLYIPQTAMPISIVDAIFEGFEALSMADGGKLSLTAEQFAQFTTSDAAIGMQVIYLQTAGTVVALDKIEYYLLADGGNTFTAATGVKEVTGGNGADTFKFTSDQINDLVRLDGGGGNDTIEISFGTASTVDLRGKLTGIETIKITGGAGATSFINVDGAGIVVEYTLGAGAANIVLGNGGQTLNIQGANSAMTTISGGAGADGIVLSPEGGNYTIMETGSARSNVDAMDVITNLDASSVKFDTGFRATGILDKSVSDYNNQINIDAINSGLLSIFADIAVPVVFSPLYTSGIYYYIFQDTGTVQGRLDDGDFLVKIMGSSESIGSSNFAIPATA